MHDPEDTDGRPVVAPAPGLEDPPATARDPVPHRGLVADLEADMPELDDELEPPDDTTTDGVPVVDQTIPINSAALEALLEQTEDADDGFDIEDTDLADETMMMVGDSTEVDLGAAASAVAAELMGPAGTRPVEESKRRIAPPDVLLPKAPPPRRPEPRAPSLSMTPEPPPIPLPETTEDLSLGEPPTPIELVDDGLQDDLPATPWAHAEAPPPSADPNGVAPTQALEAVAFGDSIEALPIESEGLPPTVKWGAIAGVVVLVGLVIWGLV